VSVGGDLARFSPAYSPILLFISPEHRALVMMEEERLNHESKRKRAWPKYEFFGERLKPTLSFPDVLINKESYREQP
jgi:hypothetical protein